jgi:GNAT superfamily N-acetyltransferase
MPTSSAFTLRDAQPEDASALKPLASRAYYTAAPEWAADRGNVEEWLTWIDDYFREPAAGQYVLVAEAKNNVIWGLAHVILFADPLESVPHPHLETLAVSPAAEGKGVASALIEGCVTRARKEGHPELTLHVYVGNDRARAVYERSGFQADWLKMRRSTHT